MYFYPLPKPEPGDFVTRSVQKDGRQSPQSKMGDNSNQHKKMGTKRSVPQPGDADYKTPTQLRNARKRRKLKNDKLSTLSAPTTSRGPQHVHTHAQLPQGIRKSKDPSLRYIAHPLKAPKVQAAVKFFQQHWARRSNKKHRDFPVFLGKTNGWRTVAKLAVRKASNGLLRIGLFIPGSHDLLEVPQCPAHHPSINSAVQLVQSTCQKLGIVPYDDTTGTGCLRHVAVNIERCTGKQQITLVWNEENSTEDQTRLLESLCNTLKEHYVKGTTQLKSPGVQHKVHSLWIHYNNAWKHSNSIFDRSGRWEHKFGEKSVVELLNVQQDCLTVPLQFPPQVFRQANIDAFTKIIISIRNWIQKKHEAPNGEGGKGTVDSCLELYGGVGTIGLHCIDLIRNKFTSSDENPFNKECFNRTAKLLKVKGPEKKCELIVYESKNASAMVQVPNVLSETDLVIVDPPRKGLDPEVVMALCRKDTSVKSLVYVSCGFDAFCRDFESLTTSGGWQLDHAEGHVLFPGSDAIETLAFFTRDGVLLAG